MNFYIQPLSRFGSIAPRKPCLRRVAVANMAGFQSTAAKAASRGRFFSTTKTPGSQQSPDPNRKPSGYHYNPTQPPPNPGPNTSGAKPRRRPPYLLLSIGALLGSLYAVNLVRLLTLPPAASGSELDAEILAEINSRGDEIVAQVLRNAPNPDDPDWTTIKPTDLTFNDTQTPVILAGPLSSSAGLPYHRVLLNTRTGAFYAVIYIGDGACGWPTVAHGGATATIIQAVMAVAAGAVKLPGGGEVEKGRRRYDPALVNHFEIAYRRRLETSRFYFFSGAVEDDPEELDGLRTSSVVGQVLDVMPHEAKKSDIMVSAVGHFLAANQKPIP
ncbi:hypothetical protein PspLS_08128 [Pyricularia sp. CBS 133598]|nr:hypothetical protein PspLS_08128 [Pyricularia sp. CBS 133598]